MGKSGGSQPTSQNVTTTSIPEYVRPYVENTLGQAYALTTETPYQQYEGQRVAGFSPMQAQAFQNIAGQQTSPQLADASNMAYSAGEQALGYGAQASQIGQQAYLAAQQQSAQDRLAAQQYGQQGANIGLGGLAAAQEAQRAAEMQADVYGQAGLGAGYRGEAIGARGVSAAEQGFGAQQAYQQMATSPQAMQAYMSPYMQNVVDVQQQEAIRQSDIQRQANQAQAVAQGAFGGSRQGVVEAEAQRNLATQLGRIQAEGQQQAFQQAQQAQQFGAGLGIQGLQAGMQGLQTGMQGTGQAMQGAGLGLQGTGQRLAAGQLGLQGIKTGLEGQQLGLSGVQTGIQAGQFGLQGAQTGISGQQAGIGGTQAATGAAGQLGNLGQTQFAQQAAINQALASAGAQQQGLQQAGLDVDYQNFLAQQQHPYQQLAFMQGMYSGLPLTQGTQSLYSNPSLTSQIIGAGTGAMGLYGMSRMFKQGGQVNSGIDVLALHNVLRK